jgi:hypothetical protein
VRLRRYCWRVGGAFELDDGEACLECSSTQHPVLDDQTRCGCFVQSVEDGDGGWPCDLPAHHDGPHACAENVAAEMRSDQV